MGWAAINMLDIGQRPIHDAARHQGHVQARGGRLVNHGKDRGNDGAYAWKCLCRPSSVANPQYRARSRPSARMVAGCSALACAAERLSAKIRQLNRLLTFDRQRAKIDRGQTIKPSMIHPMRHIRQSSPRAGCAAASRTRQTPPRPSDADRPAATMSGPVARWAQRTPCQASTQ